MTRDMIMGRHYFEGTSLKVFSRNTGEPICTLDPVVMTTAQLQQTMRVIIEALDADHAARIQPARQTATDDHAAQAATLRDYTLSGVPLECVYRAMFDLMKAYAACNGEDHPAYRTAEDALDILAAATGRRGGATE